MTAPINTNSLNDLRKLNKRYLSQLGNVKQTTNENFMKFWVQNCSVFLNKNVLSTNDNFK